MAGEPSDDNSSRRALLSSEALPKIEIPRSREREHRTFKLPDTLKTPIPRRPDEDELAAIQDAVAGTGLGTATGERSPSRGLDEERSDAWREDGEANTSGDDLAESTDLIDARAPGGGRLVTGAVLVGLAVVLALAAVWWLSQ